MSTVNDFMTTSFVLLPADWMVGQANTILGMTQAHWVILSRDDLPEERYYVFAKADLQRGIAQQPTTIPLLRALDLRFMPHAPALDSQASAHSITTLSVVRDDAGTLIGITWPTFIRRDLTPRHEASFQVYPRIDVPASVLPNEVFLLTVGFRATQDPTLAHGQHRMVFDDVLPEDTCQVLLQGDGVTLSVATIHLPLQLDQRVIVEGTVTRSAETVSIRADYYFRGVLMGQAERIVPIGNQVELSADPPAAFVLPEPEAAVDLLITVRRTSDGQLAWTAVSNEPDLLPVSTCYSAVRWDAEQAQRFAAELMQEAQDTYIGATDVLRSMGRDIAELVPAAK
jgi:hypothetical protein